MAKRHFGEVITNYDPDNEEARKLFKKAKKYLKDLTKVREVRFVQLPVSTQECIILHVLLLLHIGACPQRSQPLLWQYAESQELVLFSRRLWECPRSCLGTVGSHSTAKQWLLRG